MNSLSKVLLCLLGLLLPLCLSAQTPQIPQLRAYVANLPAGGRWYAVTNLDMNALDARIASVAGTSAANSPAPSNDFDYVSYNSGWRKLADSPLVSFDSILEANGSATSRTFSVQSGTFADSVTVGSSSLSQAGMNALTITAPYGITGIPDPRGGSSPVPYSMLLGTNALMALSVQDARAAAFAQSQFLSNEVVRVGTAAALAADLTYPIATNALTQATKALVFSGAVSNQLATHKANGAADHIDLATRTYVDNSIAGAMVPVESAAAAYIMATNALNTATNATLVANDAKTVSTNAILVANDAKAIAIAATNLINVANMPSAAWKGTNSVSIGTGSRATAAGTFALGYLAYADNAYSFVFNGNLSTNVYASHGIGTFNVNPTNGANGFYVGESTLTQVIDARVAPYTKPSALYNVYYDIPFALTASRAWQIESVETLGTGMIGFVVAASNFTDAAGAPVTADMIYGLEAPRYNDTFVGPWYPGDTNSYVVLTVIYPGVLPHSIYAVSLTPVLTGDFGPTTLSFTNDWFTSDSAAHPVFFKADITCVSSITSTFDLSLIAPAHLAATNALAMAQQALSSSGGLDTNSVKEVVGSVLGTNEVQRLWGTPTNRTFATVNGPDLNVWEVVPAMRPRIYFSADFKAVIEDPPGVYTTNTPPSQNYDYPFEDGSWSGNVVVSGETSYYAVYWDGSPTWLPPSDEPIPVVFPQTLTGPAEFGFYGAAVLSNEVSSTVLATNLISRIRGGGTTGTHVYPNAFEVHTTNALWAGIINSLASERVNWRVVTNRVYVSGNTDGLVGNTNTLFYGCSWLVSDPYDTVYFTGDGSDTKTVFIDCLLKNTAGGDLVATPDSWDVEAYNCTFVQEGTNTVPGLPECRGFHIGGKTTMYQCAIVQTNSPDRTLENLHTLSYGGDKYLDSCTAISGTNITHFGGSPVYVNNCTGFVGEPAGTFTSPLATDIRLAKRYALGEVTNAIILSGKVSVSDFASSNAVTQARIDGKLPTNAYDLASFPTNLVAGSNVLITGTKQNPTISATDTPGLILVSNQVVSTISTLGSLAGTQGVHSASIAALYQTNDNTSQVIYGLFQSNSVVKTAVDYLAETQVVHSASIAGLLVSNSVSDSAIQALYSSNTVVQAYLNTNTRAIDYKPLTNFYSDTTTTVAVIPAMKIYRVYVTNSTTLVLDTTALNVTNQVATFEVWVTQESTNTSVTWPSTNTLRYTTLPTAITANGQTTQAALRKWYDVFLTNEVTECNVYQVQ